MTSPTDEQLASLRRRAAGGWPTSHDLNDALEWLDAERAESARRLEMLNRANAGEAQQIIRAEAAEARVAEIERAIESSELLGAVVNYGQLFEDVVLEQWRWSARSRLEMAQRWAEWFAAERDWWLKHTPSYHYLKELEARVAAAESSVAAAREQGYQAGYGELRAEVLRAVDGEVSDA